MKILAVLAAMLISSEAIRHHKRSSHKGAKFMARMHNDANAEECNTECLPLFFGCYADTACKAVMDGCDPDQSNDEAYGGCLKDANNDKVNEIIECATKYHCE